MGCGGSKGALNTGPPKVRVFGNLFYADMRSIVAILELCEVEVSLKDTANKTESQYDAALAKSFNELNAPGDKGKGTAAVDQEIDSISKNTPVIFDQTYNLKVMGGLQAIIDFCV